MELSKAPRLTPFTPWAESCAGISVLPGGQGTVAGGGGGGGGGGGTAHGPAVEGGVGDDGDVRGELAPDPAELLELLYFTECSSLFSIADRFDFFRAKIFLFFLSSSDPWCD